MYYGWLNLPIKCYIAGIMSIFVIFCQLRTRRRILFEFELRLGTDDAWEAVRPHGCSPLLVFVNSKSGDNQGVKFLRRFRQILNPAQVFDLITSGPTLGLVVYISYFLYSNSQFSYCCLSRNEFQ